ncbi:hypothetical protein J3R30DRAFT_1518875 [Lentinula aciculospora]|uniref:Secreted protein n=1 Tax=Lentinula aciculospora TaxID=153920 RepID=A0A9W8ZXV4_9AGAR|nr:hypothetical protein J3R30DRAFT_1518875 [Lentinula aciculospora]
MHRSPCSFSTPNSLSVLLVYFLLITHPSSKSDDERRFWKCPSLRAFQKASIVVGIKCISRGRQAQVTRRYCRSGRWWRVLQYDRLKEKVQKY